MDSVLIDGKNYKVENLNPELQNYLVVRQEIQAQNKNISAEKLMC